MKIAIIGFPGSGKSTCFRAVTQKTKNESDILDPTKPHIGVVKVRDRRLEKLAKIYHPKQITSAEIQFEDLPGFNLSSIKDIEALMQVLGIFSGRDAVKDVEKMRVEFMLADLEIIDHRLPGLEKELKQEKTREKKLEVDILSRFKDTLLDNSPLSSLQLNPAEEKQIRGYQFLSLKPLCIFGNVDEAKQDRDNIERLEKFCDSNNIKYIEFCAKLEAEILDIEEKERSSFLNEMGIAESARDKAVRLAYDTLNYITFFTVKGDETKAWAVKRGISAIEAAGRIHSDIQKGFIKAEVLNFNELESSGSPYEAKRKGLLRLEGKEYKICDGDIIDFKFNV